MMMDNLKNTLQKINNLVAEEESLNAIEIDLLKKYTLAFYEQLMFENLTEKVESKIEEPLIETIIPINEFHSVENTFKTEFIEQQKEQTKEEIFEEIIVNEIPIVSIETPIVEEQIEMKTEPIIEKVIEIEPEIIVPKVEIETEIIVENSVEVERKIATEEEIKKVEIQKNFSKPATKNLFNKVDDLRKVISIQKKFEYIKSLFANDLEEYNKSIQQLNNMSNIDVALSYFNDLKMKQNWQEDNQLVIELLDLVNRKYS